MNIFNDYLMIYIIYLYIYIAKLFVPKSELKILLYVFLYFRHLIIEGKFFYKYEPYEFASLIKSNTIRFKFEIKACKS